MREDADCCRTEASITRCEAPYCGRSKRTSQKWSAHNTPGGDADVRIKTRLGRNTYNPNCEIRYDDAEQLETEIIALGRIFAGTTVENLRPVMQRLTDEYARVPLAVREMAADETPTLQALGFTTR
jgi:hypothetical protein